MRTTNLVIVVGLAALALAMTACASKSSTGTSSGGGTTSDTGSGGSIGTIATADISGVGTVLTNADGMTLYYLQTDDASKVTCTGNCAQAWPPSIVTGALPTAGSGVTGTLGTIDDPNGDKQLTYMGWPLYTYSGDSAPGQVNGQGSGGVWFAMTSGGPEKSGGGSDSGSGGSKYGGY
jgi:predicted lipoprotein with Yx(FWY)xxD motif